ncbi:MAG: hypothetical protein ABI627_12825, partial [Polyangiaceae bacterium]
MAPRFIPVLTLMFASYLAVLAVSAPANAAPKADAKSAAAPKADAAPAKEEAAKADDAAPKADDAAPAADADATPTDEDAAKAAPKDTLVADAEAGSSPVELPGQTYYGVGLRYRAVIVPKFMMNLFGDGGRTVVANGIGPEFTIRKNAFEYGFSAWYASYAMDPTPFKSKSDGADAWELVQSKVKVLYLTADFVWSHDLAPEFAFNYGVGAGFGFVWGDLKRQQAHPGAGANPSTGEGYTACQGPTDGNGPGNCVNGKHYDYNEPSWANGGSKPVVFPWLVLQTGLRYKPHRNFIARLDAGFGTSGFF